MLGAREAAGLRGRISPASLLVGARQALRAPDGRVFVASELARVHVYSAEGRPLLGFELPVRDFELRIAAPDRLLVLPAAGAPLHYDFSGRPLPEPADAVAATVPVSDALRIESGDVVSVASGARRVLVEGYASHAALLLHLMLTGLCLFGGGLLLIGGVLATGRRVAA